MSTRSTLSRSVDTHHTTRSTLSSTTHLRNKEAEREREAEKAQLEALKKENERLMAQLARETERREQAETELKQARARMEQLELDLQHANELREVEEVERNELLARLKTSTAALQQAESHQTELASTINELQQQVAALVKGFEAMGGDVVALLANPDGYCADVLATKKGASILEARTTRTWENVEAPKAQSLEKIGEQLQAAHRSLTTLLNHESQSFSRVLQLQELVDAVNAGEN